MQYYVILTAKTEKYFNVENQKKKNTRQRRTQNDIML